MSLILWELLHIPFILTNWRNINVSLRTERKKIADYRQNVFTFTHVIIYPTRLYSLHRKLRNSETKTKMTLIYVLTWCSSRFIEDIRERFKVIGTYMEKITSFGAGERTKCNNLYQFTDVVPNPGIQTDNISGMWLFLPSWYSPFCKWISRNIDQKYTLVLSTSANWNYFK